MKIIFRQFGIIVVIVIIGLVMTGCDDSNRGNSGPRSKVELGVIGNSSQSIAKVELGVGSRSIAKVGNISSLELHIRGLYLQAKTSFGTAAIPFIADETFHYYPTSGAVTEPPGWYSFHKIDEIKWMGGTDHLQFYTGGLSCVDILADKIKVNGMEYNDNYKFSFPTPTDIPNMYAEDLMVMNFFIKIPADLTLDSDPDDILAFVYELVEKVVVTAEIY